MYIVIGCPHSVDGFNRIFMITTTWCMTTRSLGAHVQNADAIPVGEQRVVLYIEQDLPCRSGEAVIII